jgi:hypothetical protein
LNDPATPGYKAPPDTTGGMPVIKIDGQITNTSQYNRWAGLWFVLSNNLNTNGFLIQAYNLAFAWIGNVIDFFGFGSISGLQLAAGGALVAGSEFFSSVNAGALDETKGTIVIAGGAGSAVIGCNIHDIPGISAISCAGTGALITGCILAKCGGDGVNFRAGSGNGVINCTIDGNGINGIKVATSGDFGAVSILNNIISNHTAGGAFGLTIGTGTPAINNTFGLCDYNTYYNNTANYNAVSAGPHDTALGVTPYVGQATENYTLV